jgi:hypothetical protein
MGGCHIPLSGVVRNLDPSSRGGHRKVRYSTLPYWDRIPYQGGTEEGTRAVRQGRRARVFRRETFDDKAKGPSDDFSGPKFDLDACGPPMAIAGLEGLAGNRCSIARHAAWAIVCSLIVFIVCAYCKLRRWLQLACFECWTGGEEKQGGRVKGEGEKKTYTRTRRVLP